MQRGLRFGDPWYPIESEGEARALEAELKREMAPTHRLFGKCCVAIATCCGTDDVLFEVDERGAQKLIVVHLTWNAEVSAEFPAAVEITSIDELDNWQ